MLQVVAGQMFQTAYDSAVDGDTVVIPAGTCEWTSFLNVTKAITIKGQTTTNSDTGVCNDQTKLVDKLVRVGGGQGFFHVTTTAGKAYRITGITFTGVNGLTTTMNNGAVRFFGVSTQVRLDHCHFTGQLRHSNYFVISGTVRGVSDHLVIDQLPQQFGQQRADNGGGNGDIPFTQTAGFGPSDFWFMEDCYIDNSAAGQSSGSGGWDSNRGGKYVVRHCKWFNVTLLCHGTEGSQGSRRKGARKSITTSITFRGHQCWTAFVPGHWWFTITRFLGLNATAGSCRLTALFSGLPALGVARPERTSGITTSPKPTERMWTGIRHTYLPVEPSQAGVRILFKAGNF